MTDDATRADDSHVTRQAAHGLAWMDDSGGSRFAGTWPFNLLALACVLSISAFVVFAPLADADANDGSRPPTFVDELEARRTPTTLPAVVATIATETTSPARRAQTSTAPTTSGTAATDHTTSTSTAPTSSSTAAPTPQRVIYVPTYVTRDPDPAPSVPVTSTTLAPTTTVAPTTTIASTTTTPTTTTPPVPLAQCDDFTAWSAAQAAFLADPEGLAHLDGDGDGLACEDLPGVPPKVPDADDVKAPVTRYFGMHAREAPSWMGEIDGVSAAIGKTPNMVMFFEDLTQPYPAAHVEQLWNRGMLPLITLEPIVPGSTTGQPELDELMDGTWDEYFTEWATAARDQGKPIVLRFAHEMNGNWYPWSESFPGNETGDYVAAWRHIHDIFSDVEADNVAWLWSVNRTNSSPISIDRYYPGNDYVDWVGASAYYRPGSAGAGPSFTATFSATLTQLRSTAHGKPIVFAETGTAGTDTERVAWTNDLIAGLLQNPGVYGFSWFNDIKNGNDWRIQYSSAVTAAVAAGVADPRYGAGVGAG